jgi:hypothetical protein
MGKNGFPRDSSGRGRGGGGRGRGGGPPPPPAAKPSGPTNQGGSRKANELAWDEQEDLPVAEAPLELEDTEETHRERLKVEMQRLHMSEENQELLKAALMEVRRGPF